MKNKKVRQALYGTIVNMGGTPVRQPFPTQKIEQIDPFLLLHHHTGKIKPGTNHKTAGIGPHPHRGFSPVTFILKGDVHHRDSRGNSSIISAGGVQWMNAGMGIVHSERPSKKLSIEGGTQEIIQLWINTPKKNKLDQPIYIPAPKEELVKFKPSKGKGKYHLVSGDYKGARGPVNSNLPIIAINAKFKEGASEKFEIPESYNTFIYIIEGELNITGYGKVEEHNLLTFEKEGSIIEIESIADSRFLIMGGEPLNEPLATYGPFVMNSQTEILEAMRDYQQGKMGVLVEEFE